jgi:hypothetical protein
MVRCFIVMQELYHVGALVLREGGRGREGAIERKEEERGVSNPTTQLPQ